MKKKLVFLILLGIVLFSPFSDTCQAGSEGYKWYLDKIDSVLVELLNVSHADPFFTTAIRQDYLGLGAKRVSSSVNIASFKETVTVLQNKSAINTPFTTDDIVEIYGVQRYSGTDSAYSLIKISASAVGQKEIATAIPTRYYYWGYSYGGVFDLWVYPPDPNGSVSLTVYGTYATDNFTYLRQIAHFEILLYALSRCYLQKAETDISSKFQDVANASILDLKNILENRPIDVTIGNKVLSK